MKDFKNQKLETFIYNNEINEYNQENDPCLRYTDIKYGKKY